MAKFLDKKERVYDLKLTTYGKHLLSKGTFKPKYYTLLDSEVLYDKDYARSGDPSSQSNASIELSGTAEPQNNVHKRIKEDTQYIESFVNFREVEETPEYFNTMPYGPEYGGWNGSIGERSTFRTMMIPDEREKARGLSDAILGGSWLLDMLWLYSPSAAGPFTDLSAYFNSDANADFFRFESSIGDAVFDGKEQQHAPAWKVVTLQGQISSSAPEDISFFYQTSEGRNEQKIPQINIDLNYTKTVQEPDFVANPNNLPQLISRTETFADDRVIELVRDDLVIYADEINTMLLTENFDIEVFEVDELSPDYATGKLLRKGGYGSATTGDTITISDGINTATFEFIVDGGTAAAGNIAVVKSSLYRYGLGGYNNRFGTIENLVAAINQSENTGWDGGGDGGTSRCNGSIAKCYKGTHSLNIVANDGDHGLEFDVEVSELTSGDNIVVNILNNVGGIVGNQEITSAVTDAGWTISGFTGGKNKITTLARKYFQKQEPQVVNGMMVSQNKKRNTTTELNTSAVEYYFDIFTDNNVDRDLACRGANIFNKDSYYVDLDFECSPDDTCVDDELVLYDIYGNAVGVPDIC